MDVFAAAMLGHLDLVRAHITAVPTALSAAGPHGIPLITHAKMGGEAAAPVLHYLKGLLDGQIAGAPPMSATNG